jgi:hypothetical protein
MRFSTNCTAYSCRGALARRQCGSRDGLGCSLALLLRQSIHRMVHRMKPPFRFLELITDAHWISTRHLWHGARGGIVDRRGKYNPDAPVGGGSSIGVSRLFLSQLPA